MWMKSARGKYVNMDHMECICINQMNPCQIIAEASSGKGFIMAECDTLEEAKELLGKASILLNKAGGFADAL